MMIYTESKTFRAMGTVNTIAVYQNHKDECLEAAVRKVRELHNKLSVYEMESEISRINSHAGESPVKISSDTMELLLMAKKYSAVSEGAFQATCRPLTALWHIGVKSGEVPSKGQIERAKALVSDDDLILDEKSGEAMLLRNGQGIDLGGIAKGFAADKAKQILEDGGVTEALINFGGTVSLIGSPRKIGIQHPRYDTGVSMGRLLVEKEAVVTSGDYERFFIRNGIRYAHILDPRTGAPAESGLCSVTVTGRSAAELDAVSTAIFVLGPQKGAALAERIGCGLILVTKELDVFVSENTAPRFVYYPHLKQEDGSAVQEAVS